MAPGPELKKGRVSHACGVLNWLNQDTGAMEKVVVVAGGFYEDDTIEQYLASVELLYLKQDGDLSSATWVPGVVFTNFLIPIFTDFHNFLVHIYENS